MTDLEHHLDGEDAGEDEVEGVEDAVARRVFVDWVLGGERYTAGTDDDHDEEVEVAKIDDEMTETTKTNNTQQLAMNKLTRSICQY